METYSVLEKAINIDNEKNYLQIYPYDIFYSSIKVMRKYDNTLAYHIINTCRYYIIIKILIICIYYIYIYVYIYLPIDYNITYKYYIELHSHTDKNIHTYFFFLYYKKN